MPLTDLSAKHLAGKSFEPQRGNNGLLRFANVPGDTLGPRNESILTLSLQSFGLPVVTVEAIELMFLNEKRKVAGTPNFDDIEVTFKDFVDIGTAQICKGWHEKVYNPFTGAVGLARDYKRDGLIELFAPNGSFSRFYYIEGAWPTSFNPGNIDMGSSEPIMITMTLAIDKAYAAPKPSIASLLPTLA